MRELIILNEKRARNSSHIKFLLACKHAKIYPNFINLKCKNKSKAAIRGLLAGKQCWLRNEIRAKYAKQEKLDRLSYYRWQECTRVNGSSWNAIDTAASQLLFPIQEGLQLLKTRKFNKLRKTKIKNERTNANSLPRNQDSKSFTVNLSKFELSDNTLRILNTGLCFSHGRDRSLEDEIVDLETAIKNFSTDSTTRSMTAMTCLEYLKEHQFKNNYSNQFKDHRTQFSKTELRACQEELRSKDLLVMKADKGGQTVILDAEDYWAKGREYIDSSDIVECSKDTLQVVNKLQRELKTALKDTSSIFPNQFAKDRLVLSNPQISQMYGLPKIHKKDVPLRPIVSAVNSSMYRLAKFLAKELSQLIRHQAYHVSKSSELVHELKSQELDLANLIMFSIDVDALYPSVPIIDLDPILKKLMLHNKWESKKIEEFLRLIRLVNNNNFFIFRDKLYHQKDGLAMGSPLAAILALIYMESLENELVPTFTPIVLWRRYVDDILAFIRGNKEEMTNILKKLNNYHPRMNFTIEEEKDGKIPFLDFTIQRKPEENKLQIDIYRKSTYAGRHIDGKSNHSVHHKHAFLYSAIHRIYQFGLEEQEVQNELSYLRNNCINNNIDPIAVDSIHRKILRTKELQQISKLTNTLEDRFLLGWLTLNYSKMHHELARRLRKQGIRTAFGASNTTRLLLPKLKSAIPEMQQSGVYKIECGDCNGVYIGQTRRSFATRMTEHLKYPAKSTFCGHLMNKSHSPQKATMSILLKTQDRNLLNVKETVEILKTIKTPNIQILNTVLGPCSGSLIQWKYPSPKIFPVPYDSVNHENTISKLTNDTPQIEENEEGLKLNTLDDNNVPEDFIGFTDKNEKVTSSACDELKKITRDISEQCEVTCEMEYSSNNFLSHYRTDEDRLMKDIVKYGEMTRRFSENEEPLSMVILRETKVKGEECTEEKRRKDAELRNEEKEDEENVFELGKKIYKYTNVSISTLINEKNEQYEKSINRSVSAYSESNDAPSKRVESDVNSESLITNPCSLPKCRLDSNLTNRSLTHGQWTNVNMIQGSTNHRVTQDSLKIDQKSEIDFESQCMRSSSFSHEIFPVIADDTNNVFPDALEENINHPLSENVVNIDNNDVIQNDWLCEF